MSKMVPFSIIILFIISILSGCSGISIYDDNEPAAIVKGQEITVGELRFLYPDNVALDYLDWAIEVELVKQKVKEMGLDIPDKLGDDWFAQLPPKNTTDEGGKQIRRFAKAQAKKLGMTPEDYQREYAKKIQEQNAYVTVYLGEKLSKADLNNEQWMEENHEAYSSLMEELLEENKDDIEVLIK